MKVAKPIKIFRAVVFTTPVLQHPPIGGPALRIENSILALARISQVHLHCRVDWLSMGGLTGFKFYKRNVASFSIGAEHTRFRSLLSRLACGQQVLLSRWAGSLPVKLLNWAARRFFYLFYRLVNRTNEAQEIINIAKRNKAKIVWFGYGNISYNLMKKVKELDASLLLVCDTDSVWSRFVLRELEVETDPVRRAKIQSEGRQKQREEAEWMKFCDVTTAVSEVDASYYELLNMRSRKVMLFRNVINVNTYKKVNAIPGFKSPSMFLAGSFWEKSPMEYAARWFLDSVLPDILNAFPEVHLYIAGNGSDQVLADVHHPSVSVLGRVESVLPYLCNANVALVPLFFESGTRYKILEAGACGIAVVSTTLGAEGIDVAPGKNILIADEPSEFASAVINVLSDEELQRSLGTELQKEILEKFSISALATEGEAILQHLYEVSSIANDSQ
jgi:glycosyltransferase involved in cell wall biosynthesis